MTYLQPLVDVNPADHRIVGIHGILLQYPVQAGTSFQYLYEGIGSVYAQTAGGYIVYVPAQDDARRACDSQEEAILVNRHHLTADIIFLPPY